MSPSPSPRSSRRRRRRARGMVSSRVRVPVILLVLALVYGTVGFMVIEGFGLGDALYMTVSTLTTVGVGELHPLGAVGRLFTISLIAFGVVAVFDLLAVFSTLLASGRLARSMERRAMQRRIRNLQGHFVVCAYGRVGRAATDELVRQGAEVVVIDVKPDLEPLLVEADVPYLIGDPSEESVLVEAGIHRARALLCAVDSDVVNVYITLTARALQPGLFIIARASRPESVEKLQRAGADRVISPYAVSGVRMASMALQPAVLEFMDMVRAAPDLRIEELVVGAASTLVSRSVRDACAPHDGLMLVALRRPDGDLHIPPKADTELGAGDVVIAVGSESSLSRLADDAR